MFRTHTRRLAALGLCLIAAVGCNESHDHDHDHDGHDHGHEGHDHGDDHDDHEGHDHDGDGHEDHDAEDHDEDGDTAMAAPAADSLYAMTVPSLAGDDLNLSELNGKVTLVVNVASECGLTPQYEGLEAMHKELSAQGFTVVGFPSNDFGKQEPGSANDIMAFCSANYGVSFPMAHKVQTKAGDGQSPIYAHLAEKTGELPSWNFGKYLVSRDGTTVQYFEPRTEPDDSALRAAIDAELAKS